MPVTSEAEQLINFRDAGFILTLADTGMRVHEACNLRRGDIDWNEQRAVIIGKGDSQDVVRFSSRSIQALKNYLKYLAINPFRLFKKVYMQSIMIIQPVDLMSNGDQSMCDGCPDITYWKEKNGEEKLVWSCRLEELIKYDNFLRMVPKKKETIPEDEHKLEFEMNRNKA